MKIEFENIRKTISDYDEGELLKYGTVNDTLYASNIYSGKLSIFNVAKICKAHLCMSRKATLSHSFLFADGFELHVTIDSNTCDHYGATKN